MIVGGLERVAIKVQVLALSNFLDYSLGSYNGMFEGKASQVVQTVVGVRP